MFEYKTRTERKNGCKFIEQDILLYDYIYSSDISIECHVDYQRPGFGFVITEQQNNAAVSDNTYIFKLDSPNHYQIIGKVKGEQSIIRSEYINAGASFNLHQNLILILDYSDGCEIKAYIAEKNQDKVNIKHLAFSYSMPHIIENYKVGFYSNAGNTLKFSAVSSESPSNWISNIFNGRGGRINWIKNGFEIQECEFNCEVESQINQLDAGTYYFSFDSTNKNIKYYIYPSYRKNTKNKRPLDEILTTKEDEEKNILDYKTNSFTLTKPTNINIKFVGKSGTITNIAIKESEKDSFVETDYDNIKRESSYISFDLSKIKKINMTALVSNVDDDNYYIFLSGTKKYTLSDLNLELNKDFDCIIENSQIKIADKICKLSDNETELKCLKNTDSIISGLLVTYNNGNTVDMLLQKTIKTTVDKNIKSPIIVTDKNNNPLDLSGSYRKVYFTNVKVEAFNKFKQLKLSKQTPFFDAPSYVFGFNDNNHINFNAKEPKDLNIEYDLLSTTEYIYDYVNNKIVLNEGIRDNYKYIGVLYYYIDDYRYEFTNWQRELFSLSDGYIYLKDKINEYIKVYGIPKNTYIDKNRLFYINSGTTTIQNISDVVVNYYILNESMYNLNTVTNKLTISNPEKYDYIIVDYLKNNSYVINERESYYEVDISGNSSEYNIFYDNPEKQYKVLNLSDVKANDFIVIKKHNNEVTEATE